MAKGTNLYFNNFTNRDEQNLINDLVYESIKIYGIDVGYMARTLDDTDDILNESRKAYYNQFTQIEMYIKNVDGFQGEGDFLSKFGVEIRDQITFSVARRTFSESVESEQNITRPREGDLIYFPFSTDIYLDTMLVIEDGIEPLFDENQERLLTEAEDRSDASANTSLDYDTVTDADNIQIETDADAIIDFSDLDPFSEGGSF